MSRTRIALAIVSALLPGLAFYAAVAFAQWDANPGNWEAEIRGFTAWLALTTGFVAAITAATFPSDRA